MRLTPRRRAGQVRVEQPVDLAWSALQRSVLEPPWQQPWQRSWFAPSAKLPHAEARRQPLARLRTALQRTRPRRAECPVSGPRQFFVADFWCDYLEVIEKRTTKPSTYVTSTLRSPDRYSKT